MNKNELIMEICKIDSTQSMYVLLQHDEKELQEYLEKLKSRKEGDEDIPNIPFH